MDSNIEKLAKILGVDPSKLEDAIHQVEEDEGAQNFYYNPNVFARLHRIDYEGLRKLVVPDLSRLRGL